MLFSLEVVEAHRECGLGYATEAMDFRKDAFGNVLVAEGAEAEENSYRFSTKMADLETGLVYYGYRFYSAQLGRWVNRDPLFELSFALEHDLLSAGHGFRELPFEALHVAMDNNPVSQVDVHGLWSPNAHDALLAYAFDRFLKRGYIMALQQNSRDFDKRTQAPDQSHMHFMRRVGETPETATRKARNFIEEQLREAKRMADQGTCVAALRVFAEAMHPVMDHSSPSHTDAHGDPIIWDLISRSSLRHSPTDFIGNETIHDLTPEILEAQKAEMREDYEYVFGKYECTKCRRELEIRGENETN